MATYTLPASTSVSGTIQVVITSDVNGLTVPTFDTLLSVGPKVETLSEELGAAELSTLDMRVRDDTSTHSQGFWYRLLDESTDLIIRVWIVEGSTTRTFFFGTLSEEEIVWKEDYLGSPRIRTCSFTLVDIVAKLFDINMADFLDDVYEYSTAYDCNPGGGVTSNWKYIVPLESILGVALKTAGLNSIVNSGQFVYDASNPDLKFIDGSANEFTLDNVWLPTAYWDTGTSFRQQYWDPDSTNSLEALYGGDFKAFLGDFLFNFGLFLRIIPDGALYLPLLYQRHGRAYSNLITLGSETQSEIVRSSPLRLVGVNCSTKLDGDVAYWFHKSKAPTGSADTIPTDVDFDVNRPLLWSAPVLGGGSTYKNTASIGVTSGIPSTVVQAVDFKYFDSAQAALQATTATTQAKRMQHAIAGYNYQALYLQRKSFSRRYSTIAATLSGNTTFENLNVLRRTEIADGTATDTYYASRITIDPNNYTTEIDWTYEVPATA